MQHIITPLTQGQSEVGQQSITDLQSNVHQKEAVSGSGVINWAALELRSETARVRATHDSAHRAFRSLLAGREGQDLLQRLD